jgi:hypothetical protein
MVVYDVDDIGDALRIWAVVAGFYYAEGRAHVNDRHLDHGADD